VGLQLRDNWGVWRPPSEGEDQLNTVLGNNSRSTRGSEEIKLPLCLIEHYTMKTCGELKVTAPLIVNLGARMRRIVSYTPPAATLPAGGGGGAAETHWVGRLEGRFGGCKQSCGRQGRESIGGVETEFHSFLTSAIDGVSGQLHAPATLPRTKRAHNNWTGGSVHVTESVWMLLRGNQSLTHTGNRTVIPRTVSTLWRKRNLFPFQRIKLKFSVV
jgi:hypothetical protein